MVAAAYADTPFFIATINPDDDLHAAARRALHELAPGTQLKTCVSVIIEALEYFSSGPALRQAASELVRTVLQEGSVKLIALDARLLHEAFWFYNARPLYSFTECISIRTCQRERIGDVLTHNPHFTDERLRVLF